MTEQSSPPEDNHQTTYCKKYVLQSPPLKRIHRSPSHQYLHNSSLVKTVVPYLSEPHLSSHSSDRSLSAPAKEPKETNSVEEMQNDEYDKSSGSSTIDMSKYYRDGNYRYDQESTASADEFLDDLDSMVFNQNIKVNTDNYCEPSKTSHNCVMLKFTSSPLSDSSEVIFLDSLTDSELCSEEKTKEQTFGASLTELNLSIDPSHFEPLH